MSCKRPNGCTLPTISHFSALEHTFRTIPKYVAAIDFGTTHCSVSFIIRPDINPEVEPTCLNLNKSFNRIPNCILFDKFGKCIALGEEARSVYADLDESEIMEHYYFEHVKKALADDEVCYYLSYCYKYHYLLYVLPYLF